MGTYRTEGLLFAGTVILRLCIIALVLIWGAHVGDFDGDARTTFPIYSADSFEYFTAADHLFDGGSGALDQSLLMQFRTPGYPLFVSLVEGVFGHPLAVSVIQVVLSGLLVVVVYILGLQFATRRVGLIAAALFALEPVSLFHSIVGLSDFFFTFLFICALWLTIRRYADGNAMIKGLGVAGVMLGYAALVRPIGQWLPILFSIGFLVYYIHSLKRTHIYALLAFLVGVVAVVSPWMVRNGVLYDTYQLSSFGPYNIYEYNLPLHYAHTEGISLEEARGVFQERVGGIGGSMAYYKSFYKYEVINDAVHEYLREHFWSYAGYHVVKTIPFFLTDGLRDLAKNFRIDVGPSPNFTDLLLEGDGDGAYTALAENPKATTLLFVGTGFWFVILMLGILSAVYGLLRGSWQHKVLIGLFVLCIGYFALLTGPASSARYRLPVEPLMFILAAYGGSVLLTRIRHEQS